MLKRTHSIQSSLMNSLRGQAGPDVCILPQSQRRLSLEAVASLCDLHLGDQCNRRSLGLLPMPTSVKNHEVASTDTVVLRKLLLSIESRGMSCCIRIFSEKNKSRSALLIYKGRLIGCTFGAKNAVGEVTQKESFEKITKELLASENIIDCHPLTDAMVLASASMFHGGLKSVSHGVDPLQAFQNCANVMLSKKQIGMIAVKGSDQSYVCTTYFCEGKIIGVYSFAEGWLTNTQTAALNIIETLPDCEILLSVLPADSEKAPTLTQSLTGLDPAVI